MIIRVVLVLLVIITLVLESEPAPAPHHGNDPYKPIIRILKELRKARKHKHKYGGGGLLGIRDNDDSGEDNPFQFNPIGSGGGSNVGDSFFPSGGSGGGSSGGDSFFPSGGSGADAQKLPGLPGGNGGGGDPLQQLNQGLSGLLQGLGLGPLFGF